MKRFAMFVPLLLALGACQQMQTTDTGSVGVARTQTMSPFLSSDDVMHDAIIAYDATLDRDDKAGTLNADASLDDHISRIAHRLIEHVATFRQDASRWQWEINVETNDAVSAYCAPGGKILVNSGVFASLKLSDDEFAILLSHEIAHALRDHLREKMSRDQYQRFGAQVLNALTGGKHDLQLGAALKFSDFAYNSPFSPEQEAEADAVGLELAARSGFDPHAAIALWSKVDTPGKPGVPNFVSLHPSTETRLTRLNTLMPTVIPLYEAAKPH